MAVPIKRPGVSWLGILLLTGLSALSWLSTYTGIMELITAASGDVSQNARIAVAFAVFMLQLMILYILDALFSGQLRWWLRPLYALGYCILFLIAAGFAFGFYWKYLEAGNVAATAAETSLNAVQETMQLGTSRLEQLQATFAALTAISVEKAEKERVAGGTCSGSGTGDGPRRRLRDADAGRFQFASGFIGKRAADVKADMAAVAAELRRMPQKDAVAVTGSRSAVIGELNRKLALMATRFNALRTDPQLRQLADELRGRAGQTAFPDDRGGTFLCPDPQLQTALGGVVRAINELPELHPPALRAYEGAEAVIEALRRLTNSGVAAAGRLAVRIQDALAATGFVPKAKPLPPAIGGLTGRDTIPLVIAIFVDLCILLVSINRPFSRTFHAIASMRKAKESALIEFLAPVYRVFINNFDPDFRPTPEEIIAPLVDIVFDHKGKYYAAAPLDFREHTSIQWMEARTEKFVHDLPRERSRYISSALVILQGQHFIELLNRRRALTDTAIRDRLGRQGSQYAQANSFRVYAFAPGAWPEFLHAVLGSGAEAEMRAGKRRKASARAGLPVAALEPPGTQLEPPAQRLPWVSRGTLTPLNSGGAEGRLELQAPTPAAGAIGEGVDPDPSEEHFSGLKFDKAAKAKSAGTILRLPQRR